MTLGDKHHEDGSHILHGSWLKHPTIARTRSFWVQFLRRPLHGFLLDSLKNRNRTIPNSKTQMLRPWPYLLLQLCSPLRLSKARRPQPRPAVSRVGPSFGLPSGLSHGAKNHLGTAGAGTSWRCDPAGVTHLYPFEKKKKTGAGS